MGLDMYLTAKKRISKYGISKYEKLNDENRKQIKKMFPEIFDTGNIEYLGVEFECAYWRKANAIHKWFVDNCQEGKDECQTAGVDREQLIELKKLCEEVIKNKNTDKLPSASGFFFGGTEYDEDYFEDLKLTVEQLIRCLDLPDDWYFEYTSSMCDRCGKEERYRHSQAIRLKNNNFSIEFIQKYLRHANIKITMNECGNLKINEMEQIANTFNQKRMRLLKSEIVFEKYLDVTEIKNTISDIHKYKYIELICKDYFYSHIDLMFAYNEKNYRNAGILFLGQWNDGLIVNEKGVCVKQKVYE